MQWSGFSVARAISDGILPGDKQWTLSKFKRKGIRLLALCGVRHGRMSGVRHWKGGGIELGILSSAGPDPDGSTA